jgi:hypothetical protein
MWPHASVPLSLRLTEVGKLHLHEPRRSQDGVSGILAAKQVEFDTAHGHLRRRRVDAVGVFLIMSQDVSMGPYQQSCREIGEQEGLSHLACCQVAAVLKSIPV